MSTCDVAVIDYGMGNLLSVRRGLEHCGAIVTVTADHSALLSAPRIVLPGVGAFADGMDGLRCLGLDDVVRKVAKRGVPLLGICLGMQMLLDESEEFGVSAGLGLISGRVVPISLVASIDCQHKIPHIGWDVLQLPEVRKNWEGTVLQDICSGEAVYFVHSFMAIPSNPEYRIADCPYGGVLIPAVIGKKNIVGCQFHPEKSGEVGLNILRNFLML